MLGVFIRLMACILAFVGAYTGLRLLSNHIRLAAVGKKRMNMDDLMRDRTLCFLIFAATGAVVSFATSPWIAPVCLVMAWVLSKRAPALLDAREKRELRSACDQQADIMADIIAMGVKSGLSFDAAVGLYCDKFENELADKMREARMQWTSGLASRQQALTDTAGQIGSKALRRFSETSIQAIHYGSPLADMLHRFSDDIRQRRKSAIEQQIEKAPVKMLIPTGTCILPAMLILVMGPVVLQFLQSSF